MQKAALIRDVLEDKKGEDILVLKVGELTGVTDYFVLATGRNPPHLKALAEEMEGRLKQAGERCYRRAGQPASGWLAVDFIDVVVHLFERKLRAHYNLERLWSDAPRVD